MPAAVPSVNSIVAGSTEMSSDVSESPLSDAASGTTCHGKRRVSFGLPVWVIFTEPSMLAKR